MACANAAEHQNPGLGALGRTREAKSGGAGLAVADGQRLLARRPRSSRIEAVCSARSGSSSLANSASATAATSARRPALAAALLAACRIDARSLAGARAARLSAVR